MVAGSRACRAPAPDAEISRVLVTMGTWTQVMGRGSAAKRPKSCPCPCGCGPQRKPGRGGGPSKNCRSVGEAHGQSKALRFWLEQRDVGYAVETRRNDDMITTTMGRARADGGAALPAQAWCRLAGPRE